jgi:hypothetical protein
MVKVLGKTFSTQDRTITTQRRRQQIITPVKETIICETSAVSSYLSAQERAEVDEKILR